MSKKDKLTQKINYLKFWIGICMALIISIGSWIIGNIEKIRSIKFFIGIIFIIFLVVISYKFHKKIEEYIDKLEEL